MSERALRKAQNPVRVDELGQALEYWAARWAPHPSIDPCGAADPAGAISAAIGAMYRPPAADPETEAEPESRIETVQDAAATGDEHAIKFAEVAVESHRRGNAEALAAGVTANRLIVW